MDLLMAILKLLQTIYGNYKKIENMKFITLLFTLLIFCTRSEAQLKYVIDDFEGAPDGPLTIKNGDGLFTFGNIKANIDSRIGIHSDHPNYLGERSIMLYKDGKVEFGGWGKGMGINVNLDVDHDYLNFYMYVSQKDVPKPGSFASTIKIELQEDDNNSNIYEKDQDDSWTYIQKIEPQTSSEYKNAWKLISIPLNKFIDDNKGGDGIFNISYEEGKLFCFIVSFQDQSEKPLPEENNSKKIQSCYFDFICFSKGKLPTGKEVVDIPSAAESDFCNLGAWSKEGKPGDFCDIAYGFQNNFDPNKKLGVVHFFQPFAMDGGHTQNNYPSVERINKVIEEGYIPMITLEDHFVKISATVKQPNLYSIVENHFDAFFTDWAKRLKKVNGVVLLRILHEFNGDWYPWCVVNNDKNPRLVITAFRHIHDIFQEEGATNVKFIWCPNSTSYPQEKWNYMMEAYPGDEYVDFLGLDIYNGAGKELPVWRSFRKEGIESYFILTQQLPNKPLFVCEISSRERKESEMKPNQNKAEWIKQMSEAVRTDMSKIRLLTWFNEKESFKVNSSRESQNAFLDYIWKDNYFKSGTESIYQMLHR
jgi:beta-mannanase